MKFEFENTEFNSVETRAKNGKFTEGNNLQKRQSNTIWHAVGKGQQYVPTGYSRKIQELPNILS